MDVAKLVDMANRIGDFFDGFVDRDEAREGVANHIHKFWEPRMRRALLAWVADHPDGGDGTTALKPIVLDALSTYRERLTPA